MNVHDLYEAICQLDDEILHKSEQYSKPRRSFDARWLAPVALIAAMLTLILWTPLTRDHAPGAEAPEAEAPAAPEAEAPEAEAPAAPEATPPSKYQEEGSIFIYNYVSEIHYLAQAPEGYHTQDLSAEEMEKLLPDDMPQWMQCTGKAGYDAQGNLADITLQIKTRQPGSQYAFVTFMRPSNEDELIYGSNNPWKSQCGDTEYTVYQSFYSISGDGWTMFSATARLNGLYTVVRMSDFWEDQALAREDFEQILMCLAEYSEGEPDISGLQNEQEASWPNETNGKLIVNGVDITDGNYVYIDSENQNAHLPMLAIFQALGHDAVPVYYTGYAQAWIDDTQMFCSSETEDFGIAIPEGAAGHIRLMQSGEFILDLQSVYQLMYKQWSAHISVDYENAVVYVEGFAQEQTQREDCRLVVNGVDITQGNHAKLRTHYNHGDAVLPLLAICRELGAQIQWTTSARATIRYGDRSVTVDTTMPKFGIPESELSMFSARYMINEDIMIDSGSMEILLEDLFGAWIDIDPDNLTVYVGVDIPE